MNPRNRTTKDIRFQRRIGTGLLMAGVLSVLVGVFVFGQTRRLYLSALRAQGKIVEVELRRFQKDVTCYPVFSFVDQAGATQVVHSKFGYASSQWGLSPRFAVGDAIEVIYPADNPASARINGLWSVWAWTIVFGGGGVLLAVAGVVLWHGAVTWEREFSS